ncbi:hypothetical protein LSH36_444g02045 [Paralvinella palmiformis]|uniref:Uncharacterized protein n=1 Tax=Paralvinella palmiformis TaxID=53620 RepID=A0AAD9N0D7_9ANNE|nr:hypothetical protein LSH36_444g02045 [Paralvinella palmiformis]
MAWTLKLSLLLLGISLCTFYVPEVEGARALGRDLSSLLKRNGDIFGERTGLLRDVHMDDFVACLIRECMSEMVLCRIHVLTEDQHSDCELHDRLCEDKCHRLHLK